MKHVFEIKTRVVNGNFYNRKEFNIKVAGLTVLISWPLDPAKILFEHKGIPKLKILLVSKEEKLSIKAAFQSYAKEFKEKMRILAGNTQNVMINGAFGNSIVRIRERFNSMIMESSATFSAKDLLMTLKITLFGSGTAVVNTAVSHTAEISIGSFRKLNELDELLLSEIDYDEDTNQRLLVDIENRE